MLEKLNQDPPVVTQEQWSAWRNDPITEAFLLYIEKYALDKLLTHLPPDPAIGMAKAYQRDGAIRMAEHLLEWDIAIDGDDE